MRDGTAPTLPREVRQWMDEEGIDVSPAEIAAWLAAAGIGVKGSYRPDEVGRLLDMPIRTVNHMIHTGRLGALSLGRHDGPLGPSGLPRTAYPGDRTGARAGGGGAYARRIPLPSLILLYPR